MKHWFTDNNTKPLAWAIVVCAVLLVSAVVWFSLIPQTNNGREYAQMTVVVEVDRVNDEVICKDFNGVLWAFCGCDDWAEGDIATMIMNDNGTPIIYDDVIVHINYDGWLDGWFN